MQPDPLRAADLAEPTAVFVALHVANELRAASLQASDDGVDVLGRSRTFHLQFYTRQEDLMRA